MRYKRKTGDIGEQLAADMLENLGYRIMARNYSTREGEIDIVAAKSGVIHFVEVKTRTGCDFGYPADAVTEDKQSRIRRTAMKYLSEGHGRWGRMSFDVFEVLANHIEDCM